MATGAPEETRGEAGVETPEAAPEQEAGREVALPGGTAGAGTDGAVPPGASRTRRVTIEGGDCLINILRREYGTWDWELLKKVLEMNKDIEDPNHILAGKKIVLPEITSEE
jgi:nucleoid-associated protein YgaU